MTGSTVFGINKNTATGSVPANTAYISTYYATSGLSLGRGNSGGSPNSTDLYIAGSTGNVGIGATSPATKLQVSGGQVSIAVPSTMTPAGTTQTVDFNNGNIQTINLGSATGNVTLTLSNPVAGATYVLKVIQGANSRNIVWPEAVKWSGGTTPTELGVSHHFYDALGESVLGIDRVNGRQDPLK